MEGVNTGVSMIQSVGFPITCVIALAFYVWYTTKQTQQQNATRETNMREENAKREERLYKIIDEQSAQMTEFKTSIDLLTATIKAKGVNL